jgi:hypothetical protein
MRATPPSGAAPQQFLSFASPLCAAFAFANVPWPCDDPIKQQLGFDDDDGKEFCKSYCFVRPPLFAGLRFALTLHHRIALASSSLRASLADRSI